MIDRSSAVRLTLLGIVAFALSAFAMAGCAKAPPTALVSSEVPAVSEDTQIGTVTPEPEIEFWHRNWPAGRRRPTLDSLWPNDDGRFWSYRLKHVILSAGPDIHYYSTVDSVPPVPSTRLLARWLRLHHWRPVGVGEATGSWELRFRGRGTTLSGAEGQNLVETLTPDAAGRPAVTRAGDAFLARLAQARPDLVPALRQRNAALEGLSATLVPPILVHGYIWEKTLEHIGTYGDVDQNLAWKFLEADLSPGHEFTFQLVPGLATDVFLHALVLPPRLATYPRLTFSAVEVVYVIDFGVTAATDESGSFLGFSRGYSYGSVIYVPRVGPVASTEYHGAQAGQSPGDVTDRIVLRLVGTGAGTSELSTLP